jgi:hypothetical protein
MSCDENHDEIGSQERSFSGGLLRSRRAVKRKWSVKTAPLSRSDAEALKGALLSRGHVFPFDDDAYSHKGLGPTGTPVYTLLAKYAADGNEVWEFTERLSDSSGFPVQAAKFGSSVIVEPSTVNLFADNIVQGTDNSNDTTGFSATGSGSISSSTVAYWQGSRSLKLETSGGAGGGFETATTSISGGLYHVVSFYVVQPSGSGSVFAWLNDGVGTSSTVEISPNNAYTANYWARYQISMLADATSSNIKLCVDDSSANDVVMYFDGFHLEQGGSATAWNSGSRSAGSLSYPGTLLSSAKDFTINLWTNTHNADSSARLFCATDSDDDSIVDIYDSTSDGESLKFATPEGTLDCGFSSLNEDSIQMLTFVYRVNPESGYSEKQCYQNGTAKGSSSSATDVDLSDISSVMVGTDGTNHWENHIDDLQILPYAASPDQISAWHSMGKAMPGGSKLYVDGDAVPDAEYGITAQASKVRSSFIKPVFVGGTRKSNYQQVEFDLLEV